MNRFLLTALLVPGFAGPTHADLLFSNLLQPDNGAAGFDDLDVRLATDFRTDGTPRSITSITTLLFNPDVIAHNITYSIYTDNGSGAPGALLSAFDTPAVILPGPVGNATATSSGINLQANTPYWVVGQVNEGGLATVGWDFDAGQGTDGGPFTTVLGTQFLRSPNGGALYVPQGAGNLMFALEGTEIPEPSTLPIVVITGTFGAFGWWRRRRRVALDRLPDCGPAS